MLEVNTSSGIRMIDPAKLDSFIWNKINVYRKVYSNDQVYN